MKTFTQKLHILLIAAVCGAALFVPGCQNLQTSGERPKIVTATPAGKVGQDLETAVAQATQAYVEAKHGDTGWAWSASQAISALQTAKATAADVKAALQTWNDGTKAGKTFAEKVESLFAAAVQEVAADKGP